MKIKLIDESEETPIVESPKPDKIEKVDAEVIPPKEKGGNSGTVIAIVALSVIVLILAIVAFITYGKNNKKES